MDEPLIDKPLGLLGVEVEDGMRSIMLRYLGSALRSCAT
jgi:hypothetical protein